MAPKQTSFEDRLAGIQAKAPPPSAPVVPPAVPGVSAGPDQKPAVRSALNTYLKIQLISTGIGLALIAGAVGYLWDDLSFLLPKYEDGRRVSFLESSLRDSMTEEEIKRMNEDPRLEGMTQMQKMIMSH